MDQSQELSRRPQQIFLAESRVRTPRNQHPLEERESQTRLALRNRAATASTPTTISDSPQGHPNKNQGVATPKTSEPRNDLITPQIVRTLRTSALDCKVKTAPFPRMVPHIPAPSHTPPPITGEDLNSISEPLRTTILQSPLALKIPGTWFQLLPRGNIRPPTETLRAHLGPKTEPSCELSSRRTSIYLHAISASTCFCSEDSLEPNTE